jgi:hypothetical protein
LASPARGRWGRGKAANCMGYTADALLPPFLPGMDPEPEK